MTSPTYTITVDETLPYEEFAGRTYTGFKKIEPGEFGDIDYQGFADGEEIIVTSDEVSNVRTDREALIEDMAMEIERASVGSAAYWTEEQLQAWCFKDRTGVKSFANSKRQAEAALRVIEMRQKKDF